MQIAIDGPAGVGKSTLAKALAKYLGIIYLDTGAMYRGVALLAQRYHVPAKEGDALTTLLESMSLNFRMIGEKKCLFNHDENIEEAIRKPEVSKIVSDYAKLASVRTAMTRQQQRIADETSVVMDGRDIGTVVLPKADYKFFITASVEERARRRYLELEAKGIHQNYEELIADIAQRDRLDSTRDIAPLKQADDAILVDTDALDANQVLEKIIEIISK
ncbi:MAG: (d)CMP kinase [Peptococcaceae bacterium]|nr:(d)CMP kinase [Peptococcaceae bacterium]